MRNDKFKNQIRKNKEAATSTETIVESLYEESEAVREPEKELTATVTAPEPLWSTTVISKGERRQAGRPKGEETLQKTVYIPKYLWPYVQAAVKVNGGNMQKYFSTLIEADINKNRAAYNGLAEIYRSLDEDK